MAQTSINNLARAIYESSSGKDEASLNILYKNIIRLLSEKHLINKSKHLLDKLQKIIDKDEDIIRVKITSRNELTKSTIKELEEFIKDRYKAKNVVMTFDKKEELIGGIKLEIKDEIIDITLKSKVNKLKNYLITN